MLNLSIYWPPGGYWQTQSRKSLGEGMARVQPWHELYRTASVLCFGQFNPEHPTDVPCAV